ncbi:MAG TPA: tetratricopeptide repeat protein [Tepidisphaeraceae bacterium]|nr:tetratricopeptide repeat protein [Tepidisphaeraceae bacterium]
MASDLLQIALEHHRAGRFRQAHELYVRLLRTNPDHPEATLWSGVLAVQAGRADAAIPILEKATRLTPDDPAAWHNLGQAALAAGRTTEAIAALERAVKLAPDRAETLIAWGIAHLSAPAVDGTGRAAHAQAAVFAFRQALAAGQDSAEVHHHLGVALLAAGDAGAAIGALVASLERKANDAGTFYHLAMAHRARDDSANVRKALLKAVEVDPEFARGWHALGTLDYQAGNLEIAASLFRRAIGADPSWPAPHRDLGRVLDELRRPTEARLAYGQAVQAARGQTRERPATPTLDQALDAAERRYTDPKTMELHHALSAHLDVLAPAKVPDQLLTNLYDKYAANFDEHLRNKLGYAVPELIAEAVAATRPGRLLDTLDLGCGTGLCGALLRPMAATLAGVDLSPAMIEKARERGVYDVLETGDLVAMMRAAPREAFDLLTAADVLIYTGDLSPVFDAAAGALRPGGMFAFTVEADQTGVAGDRYHLQRKTLRYTHAETYVRRLAQIHGFSIETFETIVSRTENEKPVESYLVLLRKAE